ncbi:MAG: hypothetical protein JW840_00095 [Candidatus Thermoplasmatota archaeon]|nr:hypothetical protein [Candidatus Thermoplasmatota archaeon]
MASFTAQMLVGDSDPYHGGINPTHYLFLSENSRPAWILVPQNIFDNKKVEKGKITWIPNLDSMLEDAFLMIAIYIIKDKEIVNLTKKYFTNSEENWVELYEDISIDDRFHLYEKCRQLKSDIRIVITVLDESSIKGHLKITKKYRFNITICKQQKRNQTTSNKKDFINDHKIH